MDAGRLRHRIVLEQPPDPQTVNDAGEADGDYTDFRSVRAEVKPQKGTPADQSGETRTVTTYQILIRYVAELQANWRVRYAGLTLNITSVIDIDGLHTEQQLTCEVAT